MAFDSKVFWWNEDPDAAHLAVFTRVASLEEAQADVFELNLRNAKLYSNTDMAGFNFTLRHRSFSRRSVGRVSENVIQSVCDTATALISKNRPKATFLTQGAEFSMQRKAQLLDKFVFGLFQSEGIYDKAQLMFRNATVFGTGALKIFEGEDRVEAEHVLIDEIIVDELAARTDPPREYFQRKFVDREVLKAEFPEFETEIELAHKGDHQRRSRHHRTTSHGQLDDNTVVVVESWHLRSSPERDDGKHCICIENATLEWEDYEEPEPPFVFYRWSDPIIGFYGQGLAEQLSGIQLRINRLNRFIEDAQDLIAVPRIFVPVSGRTLKLHINNEIGAIIPYAGPRPPTFFTPTAVGQEIYNYKELLKASAFEFAGISRLSAQSQKPVGLESAVALREFNDIETQRFAIQSQRYETTFKTIAKRMVKLARKIHERKGKFTSVFMAKNLIQKINWKEVDMDDDRFQITIEASSILSNTPAGRLQSVTELAQANLLDRDQLIRLLGHPDLEREQSLQTAAIDDIEATIELLLDGEFFPPEPFQNLTLGIQRTQQAYLKARRDGAPEEVLEGMRQWMEQADATIKRAQQEEIAMMAPLVAAEQPQAGPGPGPAQSPTPAGPGGPAPLPVARVVGGGV